MKNNSLKSKPVLVTVIAVVLLIVLIVISAGSRSANVIESAAGTVLTPIQGFAVRAKYEGAKRLPELSTFVLSICP